MSSAMRITAIMLKNYRQFRNFKLDLTDPETKEPLEKVCFIGSNGTGKSTLLKLISNFLQIGEPQPVDHTWTNEDSLIAVRLRIEAGEYYLLGGPSFSPLILPVSYDQTDEWEAIWNADLELSPSTKVYQDLLSLHNDTHHALEKVRLQPNSHDLTIYAPPDGSSLLSQLTAVPETNLGNALKFFEHLPAFHVSSYDQLEDFWTFLIYQAKKRDNDFQQYLQAPETQSLSVADARRKFDAGNPEILSELATHWNFILGQAGLEFDSTKASIPVQLNGNLHAYVSRQKTKADLTEVIPYNALSTGIRNFIFRFGHIYALYFNRQIERGFLLLDEPEASLFPDLQYDIIERYLSIIHNTQFIVATQSPIIASQFRACERIILEYDDDGYVQWRRGLSPEGDDPNDLLMNDFVVRSLYGKKGIEQWRRYQALRQEILATDDPDTKKTLLDEYTKIGHAYNFAPNEISE